MKAPLDRRLAELGRLAGALRRRRRVVVSVADVREAFEGGALLSEIMPAADYADWLKGLHDDDLQAFCDLIGAFGDDMPPEPRAAPTETLSPAVVKEAGVLSEVLRAGHQHARGTESCASGAVFDESAWDGGMGAEDRPTPQIATSDAVSLTDQDRGEELRPSQATDSAGAG